MICMNEISIAPFFYNQNKVTKSITCFSKLLFSIKKKQKTNGRLDTRIDQIYTNASLMVEYIFNNRRSVQEITAEYASFSI